MGNAAFLGFPAVLESAIFCLLALTTGVLAGPSQLRTVLSAENRQREEQDRAHEEDRQNVVHTLFSFYLVSNMRRTRRLPWALLSWQKDNLSSLSVISECPKLFTGKVISMLLP